MARFSVTDIVMPLDMTNEQPVTTEDENELDYSFDDAELTRQLRAIKGGRGVPVAVIAGSVLSVVTAVLLFT